MNRRNHLNLCQGCNPSTCTNCSCEDCSKNLITNSLNQAAPIYEPAPTPTAILPGELPPPPPEPYDPLPDEYTPMPLPDEYTPEDGIIKDEIPIAEEAGMIPEKVGKAITTIQAVLLIAFMTGATTVVLNQMKRRKRA